MLCFTLSCLFHPISLVLPKETGWSPKEKRLGWWRPREVSGPTRLSHSRGRCHSAAKVSASRTDWITRPRGEGLGLDVDWRLKVFCPAFLQKSGRGPGAEPWPRAAARGTLLVLTKRRRGSKGEPSPGVPPLRAAPPPAASCAAVTPAIIPRRAGMEPRPYRGLVERGRVCGGRREGSSRTPTPTAGGKRAVCRGIYCDIIPRPGEGRRNAVGPAVTVAAGRRGRRPLRGWRGSLRWRVCLARYLFTASQRGGVPSPPLRRFTTHPILK